MNVLEHIESQDLIKLSGFTIIERDNLPSSCWQTDLVMAGLASNPDEGNRGQGAAVKWEGGENSARVRRREGSGN